MRLIDPRKAKDEVRRLLRAATESVCVQCNAHKPFIYSQPEPLLPLILREVSSRVQLRVVLGVLESEGTFYPPVLEQVLATREIVRAIRGRTLRMNCEWTGWHGIIVDRSEALIARGDAAYPEEVALLAGPSEIIEYLEFFERHWAYTPESTLLELLKEDDIEATREVYVVSEKQWSDVIKSLVSEPTQLYALQPRRFEELVAELLEREGMQIQLTPRTRDGGRDILAWYSTPIGRFLYLVECKRYAPDRPVGVGLVRQLYGVVESEGASGGILITTSRFTAAAWGFGGQCGTRMRLGDYHVLVDWLEKAGNV